MVRLVRVGHVRVWNQIRRFNEVRFVKVRCVAVCSCWVRQGEASCGSAGQGVEPVLLHVVGRG